MSSSKNITKNENKFPGMDKAWDDPHSRVSVFESALVVVGDVANNYTRRSRRTRPPGKRKYDGSFCISHPDGIFQRIQESPWHHRIKKYPVE
jgi:hypothetical protein